MLFPTQPSFPRRLLLYACIVAIIAATPLLLDMADRMYRADQDIRSQRAGVSLSAEDRARVIAQYGSVEAYLDTVYPVFPSWRQLRPRYIRGWLGLSGQFQVTMFALLWPWVTILSLMIFRASMRRARVRSVHVLRCVIYSAEPAALVAAAACVTWRFYDPSPRYGFWLDSWWLFGSGSGAVALLALLLIILTYRLSIAYRRYLRFDHPLATAIASQVMIALLTLKFAADFYADMGW